MVKCEECGKEFKTTQALGGHMRFVHGIRKDKQATLFPPKRFITDEELERALSTILDTLTKLVEFKNEQGQLNEAQGKLLVDVAEEVKAQRELLTGVAKLVISQH